MSLSLCIGKQGQYYYLDHQFYMHEYIRFFFFLPNYNWTTKNIINKDGQFNVYYDIHNNRR